MKGRPKTDNPRSEALQNVRLNKEEMLMLKIKAAVSCNGNVSEFIRRAVAAYDAQLPIEGGSCFECGGKLLSARYNEVLKDLSGVVVKNIPIYRCQVCDSIESDMAVEAEIGEMLEAIVKDNKDIPKEIDISKYLISEKESSLMANVN